MNQWKFGFCPFILATPTPIARFAPQLRNPQKCPTSSKNKKVRGTLTRKDSLRVVVDFGNVLHVSMPAIGFIISSLKFKMYLLKWCSKYTSC